MTGVDLIELFNSSGIYERVGPLSTLGRLGARPPFFQL
jgi:hypothetical protein